MLGLAIALVLFVPIADWLAHHDVGSATGSLHETALDNARGRLLTLGAGLVAACALFFTALNFNLLRRNSEQADQWQRRTHELTEQGQVTDRYTKAIEQLGSDKLDVRIGGIYALERVARDSVRDHPTVMEVLTAFIREHSGERRPPSDPSGRQRARSTRPDVQAASTVIGRRDASRDIGTIDLADSNLAGVDFAKANLQGANLLGANLDGANLFRADLGGANLTGAFLERAFIGEAHLRAVNLGRANLTSTNLTGADLFRANLHGAKLHGADLTKASLERADLGSADLHDADLTGANLNPADFTGADLTGASLGANLSGANFANADLTAALWPPDREPPPGWVRDIDSGRLWQPYNTTSSETAN